MSKGQLAELALQGMSPVIREKFNGKEFKNLAHLVQRVSAFEGQLRTMCKEKYLKGTTAMSDPYDAYSDGDDPKVATAKWIQGQAPISCPWVKESENTYDFDVKKADKIFDLLLEKKQLKLLVKHVIPSTEELNGKK